VDNRGKWLTESRFLHGQGWRDSKELIGTHYNITRKRAIDTMSHPSSRGTEDEISGKAVGAAPTSDRGRAKPGNFVALFESSPGILPYLDHCPAKLMPQDHWRIVGKCIVKHMKIGPADTAICYLELDLIFIATRLLDLLNLDVSVSRRVLDKSFHWIRH
jgi:hypothetical protein